MGSDALILGGGFAGLSCAVDLAAAGLKVRVLEKKPHLGGRAYSYKDPATGDAVDNGQHLFMGCYRKTRAFLARIGCSPLLRFEPGARVDYAEPGGARDLLNCPPFLGAPLNLAWGVARLRGLSWGDKWGLVRLDRALRRVAREGAAPPELDRVTVRQWLDSLGAGARLQRRLLDPIALGVLNDDPGIAAATGLAQAMADMFYRGAQGSRLGLSTVGLSELYTGGARKFIEERGGQVIESRRAAGFIKENGRVDGIVLEDGTQVRAQAVVSTLPPWDLRRLDLPAAARGPWEKLGAAPIVSVCLWLDRPVLDREPLIGLLGTDIHWVFNKSRIFGRRGDGQYLSLVISGARRHVALSPAEILEIARRDLAACLPRFKDAKITAWKVIKEPFATLSPCPGSEALRPTPGELSPGLFVAGDWTRTGLPATIESAVASGQAAAAAVLAARGNAKIASED